MPIEKPFPLFREWLPDASLQWLVVIGCLIVAAVVLGLLVVTLRYGPIRGPRITGKVLCDAVMDLVRISPRRVWALSWLAFKESIRRRIVVVFAVFIVVLLFAGWFLDPTTDNPARLYLTFVLTATSYLVLLLALFLSAFSIPADIRSRTLHTVVTKPVRSSEIVLGRILGFTLVGTTLLAVMSVISFVFVGRLLDHSHKLSAEQLRPVGAAEAGKPRALAGRSEPAQGHSHKVYVDASGEARADSEHHHWHELQVTKSGEQTTYSFGPAEGMLLARVPIYGKLRFRDISGTDKEKGISVGDEWVYRSYIQGGSQAAAVWSFKDVREEMFPEGLPVEMNIGVFRTYKGDIEKGVLYSLSLRNPRTGLIVEVSIDESREFVPLTVLVPRKITRFSSADVIPQKIETPEGIEYLPARKEQLDSRLAQNRREFDLFEDLVSDGDVEVWLKCVEPAQYFGAGQPDLYLRAADASFTLNFFKGYWGIWLQMVLIIGFGVMFSTFLSGPVAMLATVGTLIGGLSNELLGSLSKGEALGGGPFEAFWRLVTQSNITSALEPSLKTDVVKTADMVSALGLRVFSAILPPFGDFSYAESVAYGFYVSWNPWILVPTLRAMAFLIPVFVAGYFFLKTREVAR